MALYTTARAKPIGPMLVFAVMFLVALILVKSNLAACQATTSSERGPTPGLTQDAILKDGWISLFDGQTLFGWTAVTDANWQVKDGTINVSQGQPGLLRTTTQYDDFELLFEFKSPAKTNSGVFLRTSPKPLHPTVDCYELNIAPRTDHDFPTGSLVGRAATQLDFESDIWQTVRVLANGPLIKIWIGDEKALEYTDPQAPDRVLGRGFLGLQFKSGAVSFRNLRLRPLNVSPLELTDDLKAWNTDQKLESQFSVTQQGELHMTGGKGQIETVKQFGDFTFSMQCKTNADGLNSGVFFRCIPGDLMNGYESQIQNQFKDNDPTDPIDCGTGGIFRRVNARRVNADDQVWFTKTIIATGPHISVWVNGYQVTDWHDNRPPNKNPRKGLRTQQGTIIFQGHDPTTDILIKNVRSREQSPRGR